MSDQQARAGIHVRTTAGYLAWVGRLAQHCRRTQADAIADGLELLARESGFEEVAPQRVVAPHLAGHKIKPLPLAEPA